MTAMHCNVCTVQQASNLTWIKGHLKCASQSTSHTHKTTKAQAYYIPHMYKDNNITFWASEHANVSTYNKY